MEWNWHYIIYDGLHNIKETKQNLPLRAVNFQHDFISFLAALLISSGGEASVFESWVVSSQTYRYSQAH